MKQQLIKVSYKNNQKAQLLLIDFYLIILINFIIINNIK